MLVTLKPLPETAPVAQEPTPWLVQRRMWIVSSCFAKKNRGIKISLFRCLVTPTMDMVTVKECRKIIQEYCKYSDSHKLTIYTKHSMPVLYGPPQFYGCADNLGFVILVTYRLAVARSSTPRAGRN